MVSVEVDLAREGSKLNLIKRKKIQCTQAGQNTYICVAKPDRSKSEVAKQVLASIRLDCTS